MIEITAAAVAELRHLLAEKQAPSGTGLRLMVERGGCAGMQYAMTLGTAQPGDQVIEQEGVAFIVEAASSGWLEGSKVDYEESLNDSGFKIHNPNAARSCGCGTSFEPAARPGPEPASAPWPNSSESPPAAGRSD